MNQTSQHGSELRTQALLILLALLSLLPIANLATEWLAYTQQLGLPLSTTPPRGFDGVRWTGSANPTAAFVFPNGPAYKAGVEVGDVLARVDYQGIASADQAVSQIDRAAGTVLTYDIRRGAQPVRMDVSIGRYPTFLYPLTAPLWAASGWGFAIATILHLLALLTSIPLARKSAPAGRTAILIGTALLWVGGTLVRILVITAYGVPEQTFGLGAALLDGVTILSFAGWTFFPALLLRHFILSRPQRTRLSIPAQVVLFIPPTALAIGVSGALIWGHLGPLPADGFVAPILFYVCAYLAAGSLFVLTTRSGVEPDPDEANPPPDAFQRFGYFAVLVLALLGLGFALSLHPSLRAEADLFTGWFVSALQLFSLLPVTLVSLAILRFGGFEMVLLRALRIALLLALVFAVVFASGAFLNALLPTGATPVALGLLVMSIAAIGALIAPLFQHRLRRSFESERHRARRRLDRFGDDVRLFLNEHTLAAEAIDVICTTVRARSGALFIRDLTSNDGNAWVHVGWPASSPDPTPASVRTLVPALAEQPGVWSRNAELNDVFLRENDNDALQVAGVALTVPIQSGAGEALGLIVLGRKARRLSVYSTEEVELLRTTAGQIALAVERLALLEREKSLVRQTAEAELTALRAQINPHFLFNALNTVAALITERPAEAETTVENLAGLFRDVLTASGKPCVPLRDELRLVRRYLDVETARFGDNLRVSMNIADDAWDLEVPAFAVQTLVENAVKHGVERKRGGGRVSVDAAREGDTLTVSVSDTGVGVPELFGDLPPADEPRPDFFGEGLTNVDRRLKQLYTTAASLAFISSPKGTRVSLRIPITATDTAAPPAFP